MYKSPVASTYPYESFQDRFLLSGNKVPACRPVTCTRVMVLSSHVCIEGPAANLVPSPVLRKYQLSTNSRI